jgi:hypothetical protein
LGRFDFRVGSSHHGAKDGGPQGTSLARPADFHGAVADVSVDLHHQGILFGDAATIDHLIDGDAILLDAADDSERPKGGRLNQGPIDLARRRMERLPDDQPGE